MPLEMSGWRFLLDETIDPKTATYLEKEGIHAEHVRDALWQGADASAVATVSQQLSANVPIFTASSSLTRFPSRASVNRSSISS
jgi:predicted nuclease of predicted toxin-antitoxin system